MIVTILGSGSRGNAILLESSGARVLVDAGFGVRSLAARCASVSIPPESIGALVLTHEHGDHAGGACAAARKWGWTVFATAGTIAGTPGLSALGPTVIQCGRSTVLDTMRLSCVRTPHDAAESIALVAEGASGERVGIAYDLGHAPDGMDRDLDRVDALIVEANHDEGLLHAGPYPPVVQARIASARGHLSNLAAARLARTVAHAGLRHLVLAHLSQQNNTPDVARRTVEGSLRTSAFRGTLSVAGQDRVVQFDVARAQRVEQLMLFGT